LKIIFMGKEKEAAIKSLLHLLERGVEIIAIVGPPAEVESPSGFKLIDIARSNNIHFCTETEIYNLFERQGSSLSVEVDYVLSFLYWNKIKEPLLSAPKQGCINFHPAPLPEYRGVGGYNIAILDGLPYWGVSAHFIDESIDTGDIIAEKRFSIDPTKETALSLERKSMKAMYELFIEVVDALEKNLPTEGKRQPNGRYISFKEMEEMKEIALNASIEEVEKRIRAFWFPPYRGAYIEIAGRKYTLVNDELLEEISSLYKEVRRVEDEYGLKELYKRHKE